MLKLEASVDYDSDLQRVTWGLCEPNGGDMVLEFSNHLSPDEQERWAKAIVAALEGVKTDA